MAGDIDGAVKVREHRTVQECADDPGETKDLSSEQQEKLKVLQAAWHDYAEQVGVILAEQGE